MLPAFSYSQSDTKTRMYGDGNTSIKINDSANYLSNSEKRIWLENSALAFSENGEELYFRHPTEKYFQIWNVASKQKISDISFSEAGTTAQGRSVIAAFPNIIYREDAFAHSKIWLSPDLNVSFGNRNNFTISDGQNQTEKSFTLKLRNSIDDNYSSYYKNYYKKADIENTKYQLYFHKKSNKLFIIAYADQVTKNKKDIYSCPYNGIFCYDLASNTLTTLAENPDCVGGFDGFFKDKWYFFNDNLFRRFVKKGTGYFSQFNLSNLNQEDLVEATKDREHSNEEPSSWKNSLAGIDLQANVYFVDPTNNHIEIYYFDNSHNSKGTLVTILNSSNKLNTVTYEASKVPMQTDYARNEIRNVVAISLSGKYFAYLSLNNRTEVGNYASIIMYNVDENDRVYTLNDQTKYSPYITKGYVTNKESEDLDLVWQKLAEEKAIARKKQEEANAIAKKKQEDAAKLDRQKRFTPQLDSLKTLFMQLKKERDATLKGDIDLYTLGNYKAVLVRNKWSASQIYKPYSNSPDSHKFKANEEVEFRYSSDGVYAVIKERLTFPVSKKTDKSLLLTGDPGFYEGYVEGVTKGEQYITSQCDAPLEDWNVNEFRTKTDPYPFCQVKGLEILEQGDVFKNFGKRYHGCLMKANFKLKLLEDNTFLLTAQTSSGVAFVFDMAKTSEQMALNRKMYDLRNEINKLEKYVEYGN